MHCMNLLPNPKRWWKSKALKVTSMELIIIELILSIFFLLYTFGFIHKIIWWICER